MKTGKDFFGPPTWKSIHYLASIYSPNKKYDFLQFLECLTKLFPCQKCRMHLKDNLKTINPKEYLGSRDDAFLWSYHLHELVNKQLKKPSFPYQTAKKIYFNHNVNGGAALWQMIHAFAGAYTESNKKYFKMFINAINNLVPWENFVPDISDYLCNNHNLFLWTYFYHDLINQKLGKISPKYGDIKLYYFARLGPECTECNA